MNSKYRYYQQEAENAICDELKVNNKCLVKMFCGSGKSLLMRKCKFLKNKNLIVYVFPSLALINQFHDDYLFDWNEPIIYVSSESETGLSTTDPEKIQDFLKKNKKNKKIICSTYQSFNVLLSNLNDTTINVCIYDEAHHAVGETYQKLIFENEICEKQIFFTATPSNKNGITMYDRYYPEKNQCGKLVYDYTYLNGVNDDYLNSFEIRIDMYTENSNKSVYESIARAILVSGNSRVLTFHADVTTDSDTSVLNFANQTEMIKSFNNVLKNEFPEKKNLYKSIKMVPLHSGNVNKRTQILKVLDDTPDNEIMIVCSCETIGEGVDTKKANMCVFVDPRSSYVRIIQNIGRIVRKPEGCMNKSTILIPCWVDKEKYIGCNGDREKCDEVIREDMAKEGNFNGILNVMSALKQEDEDIYDICLHYPDRYTPQEIYNNLKTA